MGVNSIRKSTKIKKKNSIDVLFDEVEFEIPSWNQIYSFLLEISNTIQYNGFQADIILGVSRGGWIPARILSDLLGNPMLANIKAEFYIGATKSSCKPIITQPASVSVEEKTILLVDDVADSGESLKLVHSHLKEHGASTIRIATIYYKPWSGIVPDYYAKKTSLWIVFPWEIKETIGKTLEKFRDKGRTVKDAEDKLINMGVERQLVERFAREILGDEY